MHLLICGHQRSAEPTLRIAAEWRLTMKMKHILFPIDFSECSRTLNREVEWVANRFDSQVTLLHVFEIPLTCYGTSEVAYISPECLQQVEDDAKQRRTDYPI